MRSSFASRLFCLLAAAGILLTQPRMASAQPYPARPVRIIVPFAPSGTTDIFARIAAQRLTERLGKSFYVENIAGASGNIGTTQAARAAADGYTLLFAFSSHVVNPSLLAKTAYDPVKDFDPVTLAVSSTAVITVNPSVPAKSLQELIDLIRANPGKYSFASPGAGTQAHLAGEQLRISLGLDLVHVPYNGAGPAIASVVAGHTPIGVSTLASAGPHLREQKLRGLAVTAKTRSQVEPNIPTTTELGYPQIEGDSWVGVLVPAGTPKEIVRLLHREITEAMALPEIKDRLISLGFDPVASTPEEFAARITKEIELWRNIIRKSGIKPQ
jgi:tripartite-type tricarboxylate transporter receptor subunit TctC